MPQLENKEILGISLALWSGCLTSAKAISNEPTGGPNVNSRDSIIQILEKLSSERPIFGLGVELGLLWKVEVGQGLDVDLQYAAKHFRIRKYEDLWHERLREEKIKQQPS